MSVPSEQGQELVGNDVAVPTIRTDGSLLLPRNWDQLESTTRQEMVPKLNYFTRVLLRKRSEMDCEVVEGTPFALNKIIIKKIKQPFVDLHQMTVFEAVNGESKVTYQWTKPLDDVLSDFIDIFKHPLSTVGEVVFETDDEVMKQLAACLEQKPSIVLNIGMFSTAALVVPSWAGFFEVFKKVDPAHLQVISVKFFNGTAEELHSLITTNQWLQARELNFFTRSANVPLSALLHFDKFKVDRIVLSETDIRHLVCNFLRTVRPIGSFFDICIQDVTQESGISRPNLRYLRLLSALTPWGNERVIATRYPYGYGKAIQAFDSPRGPIALALKIKSMNENHLQLIGVLCRNSFLSEFPDFINEFDARINPLIPCTPPERRSALRSNTRRSNQRNRPVLQVSIDENLQFIPPLEEDPDDNEEKPVLTPEERYHLLRI